MAAKYLANGKYACITVKGPYTDLKSGYEVLEKWVAEKGLIQRGKMMEVYENGLVPINLDLRNLRPNLTTHPSDFVTKVCVPIY